MTNSLIIVPTNQNVLAHKSAKVEVFFRESARAFVQGLRAPTLFKNVNCISWLTIFQVFLLEISN